MKAAVLSDIHGNHIALKACIEEIERRKIEKLIFLGDYVGELAYPQKTMALIRELMRSYECYFIRGNKEDYWIDRERGNSVTWKDGDSTTGAMLYTYSNLNKEDLSFFKSLSHTETISFEGLPPIAAYHGSHDGKDNKLPLKNENLHILFEDAEEAVILCGHTHICNKLMQGNRILLNPGSVGVPLQSNGLSQFLILSGEQGCWDCEFVDLAYDVEHVIQELREEDLYTKAPCWTKVTEYVLRHGDISNGKVLARAMQLVNEDCGKCCWPDIPEMYWERAVEELKMS